MSQESPPTHGQRRLAAIVFTDVAGYSARMQADETGTLGLVREDFARMRDRCASHGGEVLKSTGDGLLLCFGSVVQAVAWALQIQHEFGRRSPDALQHRIGVHLGDVFREGGDVAGDGVNIAARLQTKARPGTICVSQSVYEAVKGKLSLQAEPLGPQSFKNITEAITVYLLRPEGAPAAGPARRRIRGWWLAGAAGLGAVLLLVSFRREVTEAFAQSAAPVAPEKPPPTVIDEKSIAVLPFANMSDDKDNAYFADGVHEDVLTQLALIGELKVTSRTSVAEYAKTTKNIRQIAAELGVANILEGSVRRTGDRVRVTAQLIEARTDRQIWAGNYDRELHDVFAIQTELATEIAHSLQATLSPDVQTELARIPTRNMAAYELLLRQQATSRESVDVPDLDALVSLLSQAVKLDPGFAIAWARLGTMHARMIFDFQDISPERLARAQAAINKALELAPAAPDVRLELGNFYYYGLRDYTKAESIYEEILATAPHHVEVLAQMGYVLRREGRFRESNAYFEKVLALDPRHLRVLGNLYYNFMRIRDYPGAKNAARRMIALRPLELSYQVLGQRAEWMQNRDPAVYAAWRAQLAPGAETRLRPLAAMDFNVALARRDFADAERLLAVLRDQARPSSLEALFWRARGDAVKARQTAEAALAGTREILQKRPDDPLVRVEAALLHALLGETEAAWRDYRRASELMPDTRDAFTGADIVAYGARIHALLGERTEVLAGLRQTIRAAPVFGAAFSPSTDLAFASLWDDPEFKAAVADPANNAPLQ